MNKPKMETYEVQELAAFLLNLQSFDEVEDDAAQQSKLENSMADKWGIDFDSFEEIANGIFKLMDFGVSCVTTTPLVGISKGNEWIAKKDVNQQFLNGIVGWCTEGETIPPDSKGFVRQLINKSSGEPEYDITISLSKTPVK